jgi:hypothetical protein
MCSNHVSLITKETFTRKLWEYIDRSRDERELEKRILALVELMRYFFDNLARVLHMIDMYSRKRLLASARDCLVANLPFVDATNERRRELELYAFVLRVPGVDMPSGFSACRLLLVDVVSSWDENETK